MNVYRFLIEDGMNEWAYAIEVKAIDQEEALARATSYMFARRDVGEPDGLVHLVRDD